MNLNSTSAHLSTRPPVVGGMRALGGGGRGGLDVERGRRGSLASNTSLYGYRNVVSTPGKLEPRELC